MNVLVIGTGAIGCFYGALLAKAGANVYVVARSDCDAIRKNGIRVRSTDNLGDFQFHPAAVVKNPDALEQKPDYVLLCTKIVKGLNQSALLQGALGPDTRIVLIANGVEIESTLSAAYPDHELISGLAFICVTRTAPGQVRHDAYGRLMLGIYPQGLSAAVLALSQAFKSAGVSCITTPDIVTARWQKCVWNAAFSPLSVLSGGLDTTAILDHGEDTVRKVMEDVCRLAEALGHPLPGDSVNTQIANTRAMKPYKTSMLLDYEAGRAMETEIILGNAVRAARRVEIDTPYLESLYALMKLRERQIAGD